MTFHSSLIPINEILEQTEVKNTSFNHIEVLVNAVWKHHIKMLFYFWCLNRLIFMSFLLPIKVVLLFSPLYSYNESILNFFNERLSGEHF